MEFLKRTPVTAKYNGYQEQPLLLNWFTESFLALSGGLMNG